MEDNRTIDWVNNEYNQPSYDTVIDQWIDKIIEELEMKVLINRVIAGFLAICCLIMFIWIVVNVN